MEEMPLTDLQDAEKLRERVDSYYWHHSIDLGRGVVTKGASSLEATGKIGAALFDGLALAGRDLLDIGAWNGSYTFDAKRRGCARVLASDKFCWTHPEIKGRETFELAKAALQLDVDALEIDVPDIKPETVGTFDVVLFSGVFYHLINAVHLTRQISACARHVLILETHQDLLDYPRPGMVFYPGRTLANDDTNWWGPNPQALYEMLKEFGFSRIFYSDAPEYDDETKPQFRKRGIFHAFRDSASVELLMADNPRWMDLDVEAVRAQVFAVQGAGNSVAEVNRQIESLQRRIEDLVAQNVTVCKENENLRESTSWRITAPLRAIAMAFKR